MAEYTLISLQEDCQRSPKIAENCQRLLKIAEDHQRSPIMIPDPLVPHPPIPRITKVYRYPRSSFLFPKYFHKKCVNHNILYFWGNAYFLTYSKTLNKCCNCNNLHNFILELHICGNPKKKNPWQRRRRRRGCGEGGKKGQEKNK